MLAPSRWGAKHRPTGEPGASGKPPISARVLRKRWIGARLPGQVPALSPLLELGVRRLEVASYLGQLVADADGRALLDAAGDVPVRLELAQALGEEAVGDAGYALGEFAEPQAAGGQGREDRPGPALADQLDPGVEVGANGCRRPAVRGRGLGGIRGRGLRHRSLTHPAAELTERK